jgi:agmatinase
MRPAELPAQLFLFLSAANPIFSGQQEMPMPHPPTFAIPPGFLGLPIGGPAARVSIAGIPLDIGTTNRPGARFGPAAIRRASAMLVDGAHPQSRQEPAKGSLADLGDFAVALGDLEKSLGLIESQAAALDHLVALGGDHSVTLALLRALAKRVGAPLGLVHFDAHVDTWPDSFGQTYGHGSVFYHGIEEGLVDPRRTVQIGIRSPVDPAVMNWTRKRGVTVLDAETVQEKRPAELAAEIVQRLGSGPAYLSFDIDALDPAFAPGTGTPEVGGLSTYQAQAILRRLGAIDFRGMDLMEVSPPYDHAEITALAGATLVWEYLCLVLGR